MAKAPKKSTKSAPVAAPVKAAAAPVASPFGNTPVAYPTTIEEIVAAGPGGTYAQPAVYETFVTLGLAEVNTSVHDGNGGFAIRATPKGREYVARQTEDAALSAATPVAEEDEEDMETVEASGFEIDDDVDMPELGPRVGFGRKSIYPFATLKVGQSFLVKGVTKDSKKFKGLASTVSAAQRRYAQPIAGQTKLNKAGEMVQATQPTRRFALRSVDGGARVWRTA